MFHPLSVYVGLRYVRARSHKFFVSFITWASLVGVCVILAGYLMRRTERQRLLDAQMAER